MEQSSNFRKAKFYILYTIHNCYFSSSKFVEDHIEVGMGDGEKYDQYNTFTEHAI